MTPNHSLDDLSVSIWIPVPVVAAINKVQGHVHLVAVQDKDEGEKYYVNGELIPNPTNV